MSSEEDEGNNMSSSDDEEEEEVTLLARIEQAELLLQQLKINITAAGDNKAAAVSTLFTKGEQLKDQVVELIDEIAPQEANDDSVIWYPYYMFTMEKKEILHFGILFKRRSNH